MGDSLLKGTEESICQTEGESQYVALWKLRSETLPRGCNSLSGVQTTVHCYSYMWPVNDTAIQNLSRSKDICKALGEEVKNIDARVIFSSILPVGRKGADTEK